MSIHNIQFYGKKRKCLSIFVFWRYRKNFNGTKNKSAMVNESSVFKLLKLDCKWLSTP